MSYFRTAILLAALTALFMGVGAVIGGQTGMFIALAIALGMNAYSYWNSDKMVLRMNKAQEVDERTAPEFHRIVRDLARDADMPMPRVFIMQNDQPNAFATGRNPQNAAVAATTGLLNQLSNEEVAGVMAHELAHIRNYDTLIMTVTATVAGAISMLAHFGLFFGGNRNNPFGLVGMLLVVFLAPLAAAMVQMAISRSREYQADKAAAEICRQPMWLASALNKISGAAKRITNETAERNPATAHMFIVNPLSGRSMDNLFSTHPSPEDRIERLQAMAREMGHGPGGAARSRSGSDSGSVPSVGNGGPWGEADRRAREP